MDLSIGLSSHPPAQLRASKDKVQRVWHRADQAASRASAAWPVTSSFRIQSRDTIELHLNRLGHSAVLCVHEPGHSDPEYWLMQAKQDIRVVPQSKRSHRTPCIHFCSRLSATLTKSRHGDEFIAAYRWNFECERHTILERSTIY
jgi:hypothetical protein